MAKRYPNEVSAYIAESYVHLDAEMRGRNRNEIECNAPTVRSENGDVVVPMLGTVASRLSKELFRVAIDRPVDDIVRVSLQTKKSDLIGVPYREGLAILSPEEVLAKIQQPMGFAALMGVLDISSLEGRRSVGFGLYGVAANSDPVLITQNHDGEKYADDEAQELLRVLSSVASAKLKH